MDTIKVLCRMELRDNGEWSPLAIFPTVDEGLGRVACYGPIDQHSTCVRAYVRECTRPATEEEAARLLSELRAHVGYRGVELEPIARWPRVRRAA